MKPQRRVMSTAHVIAFKLECGHTVHRPPLSSGAIIPMKIACDECQNEAFRRFDLDQAVARAIEQTNEAWRMTINELPKNG